MEGIQISTKLTIDRAEAAVRQTLASQGFGILTEIDVAAVFREKLGIDRPALKILGACNANLAQRALAANPATALVLPCNVVLEATGDTTTNHRSRPPRHHRRPPPR